MFNGAVERDQTDPASLDVAFYLFAIGSQTFAQPYLSGRALGTARGVTPGTILRIEWPSETVLFKVDGAVVESAPLPQGLHRGGATLYRSGDRIQSPQFGALAASGAVGSGSATLRLAARGSSSDSYGVATLRLRARGTPVSTGAAHIRLLARGSSSDSYGVATLRLRARGTGTIDPPVVNYGVATLSLKGSGTLHYPQSQGAGTARLRLRAVGSEFSDYGNATLRLVVRGASGDTGECTIFGFQSPGISQLTMGYATIALDDVAAALDFTSTILSILARDRAHVTARPGSTLTGVSVAFDSVLAADGAKIVFDLLASAEAAADDSAAAFIAMLLEAADVALATGLASTQLDATLLVAALAEANDAASLVGFLEASDLADVFDAAAISRIALVAAAMDVAAASDIPETTLRLVLLGDDAASTADATGTTLSAVLAALEQGNAIGIARIAGETYMTYAMTLDGAAVSEISGIGFDSQTTIGGRMYAVNENGIYLCEGDTDDGAPINASIYSGLSALGTQLKKAAPYAYIGYTSDGTLLFKVSTTDAGIKKTNVYKLNPVQKSVVSDNRFQISKGLHSVYFGFELTNLDGADFELETIKVWRMPLNRRK
jgi:hypothetical protein